AVRQIVDVPILRKDFIIDPYQVYETRAAGADAVLLISSILPADLFSHLYTLVLALGMKALVEVHDTGDLERALQVNPGIIGVNNRNLHTFEVNLDPVAQLVPKMPASVTKVAESGIHTQADVEKLIALGVDAMLVGESIVTAPDPGSKAQDLCEWGARGVSGD
ncbi:MAG: indole-3-glycerol-phosphate synthase, partial [Anaerolineae bacterium]|nr:indole-3-glycerol-phosphate synthase [Anaerolineae bacterium]